jgi:acyl-CoA synthetase (NDP forming)
MSEEVAPSRTLSSLLAPHTVALVGASDDDKKFGGMTSRNMMKAVGQRSYFVNRSAETVRGLSAYRSLADIPEPIDAVVLAVGADAVIPELERAAHLGARAAVVFAAGFAEAGPDGVRRQRDLASAARECGVSVLGPNCVGMFATPSSVDLSSVELPSRFDGAENGHHDSMVAIVSQSGSLAIAVASSLKQRPRYLVSTGNEAALDAGRVVEHLVDTDPGLRCVGLMCETIRNRDSFIAAGRRAAEKGVRLVLLKLGTQEAGQSLAALHTGALVGSDEALQAFCEENGFLYAQSLRTFRTALQLLERGYQGDGGLGVFTTSGGSAVLTADHAERTGVVLATLSDDTRGRVGELLGMPADLVRNPLDTRGLVAFDAATVGSALTAFSSDPEVGLTLVPLGGAGGIAAEERVEEIMRVAEDCPTTVVPIWQRGPDAGDPSYAALLGRDWAAVPDFECVIDAAALIQGSPGPRSSRGESSSGSLGSTGGQRFMTLAAGIHLLVAGGVRCAPMEIVGSRQAALAASETLGWPVALKVDSPSAPHKTELGLVRYPLGSPSDVASAYDELVAAVDHHQLADAAIVVQQGAGGGLEMLVSILRDAQVGDYAVIGFGGILTELVGDRTVVSLEGRSISQAREAVGRQLRRLKLFRLLEGYRGGPAYDLDRIVDAVVDIWRAVRARAEITAVEINPLIVGTDDQGPTVVDVLIACDGPQDSEPAGVAASPASEGLSNGT